jgi:hypothetical protein
MRDCATIAIALGLAASLGRMASAEDNPSKDEEAKIQFEQGKEFFNDEKFEQAAIALSRAYELRPSPKILYYLGMAEAENGNYARAYEAYERYLEQASTEDPARVEEVRKEVSRLSTRIGHLTVSCAALGAKVQVDGETKGTTPLPSPVKVSVGSHTIEVVLGTEVLLREVLRIAGGQSMTLEASAPSEQPEPTAAAPVVQSEAIVPPLPPPLPEPRRRVWTYVTGGVALATGIASGVLGSMALSKEKDLRDQCAGSICDSALRSDRDDLETLSLATDILWISAATMGTAAIVLFFVEGRRGREPKTVVSPAALRNGPGFVLVRRF